MTHFSRHGFRLFFSLAILLSTLVVAGDSRQTAVAASRVFMSPRPARGKSGEALELHRKQHQALRDQLSQSLKKLADDCDAKNVPQGAEAVRAKLAFDETETASAKSLPTHVQPDVPADLPEAEREWRTRLAEAQQTYAKDLYLLSRRALGAGFPSYAYELVREVVRRDPDNKPARRLLGYVRQGDEWLTPFAAKMARDKFVWHEKFGWIAKSQVDRYENGERFYQGRWIPAEKEAAVRQDFKNAWEVRTENYLVKTNVSLERGVEIARELEDFHDFFVQTFAAFFNTPEQLEKLFRAGGEASPTRARQKPYVVHYFRTRDEYADRLRSKIPMIDITNGLYYTTDRIAYFFHDPEKTNDSTLFHEATHQLFYEIDAKNRSIAEDRNFWIVEGIACYMESFKQDGGRVSLGDPRYERFAAARYRYLTDGYYIPLAQFAEMGLKEFQSDTQNISKNYSQASGLSHFFMQYDNGRYRDALIAYLTAIYAPQRGRKTVDASLEKLVGVEYPELDGEYGEYLKEMEANLAANSR